jgi:uncharacterized repeat protein (TIGR01451 family)
VSAACWLTAASAFAAGTPACTDITNQATATYTIGSDQYTQDSNVTTTTVAELLNVNVVWQDAANVLVNPGDSDQALTFLVTNTGNGSDSYTLEGLSDLPGDDFDPVLVGIYLDTNGSGVYEAGVDEAYSAGVNDPTIPADGDTIVFVLNDIPTELLDDDLGDSQLTVTSVTGSGSPGTVIPGGGECGNDAVVGTSGGRGSDIGTYVVSAAVVSVTKSATILDPYGGSQPVPGAVITYHIAVTVAGSSTAQDVVVVDPIPENTTYNPNTLELNSVSLTDELDADAGDVGGTTPGAVTVDLGDLTSSSPIQTIGFGVTIN